MFDDQLYREDEDFGVREEYDDPANPEKMCLIDESNYLPENTAWIEADMQDTYNLGNMR